MHLKQPVAEAATRTNPAPSSPASRRLVATFANGLAPGLGDKQLRSRGAERISEPNESSATRERSAATCCGGGVSESFSEAGASRSASQRTQTMSEPPTGTHGTRAYFEYSQRMYLNVKPAPTREHQDQCKITAKTWPAELKFVKKVALLSAVCLILGWPRSRGANATISDEHGRSDNQLAQQLIDIHRRIHILNRITQLADASKHNHKHNYQQLADGTVRGGPLAHQDESLPGSGRSEAPGEVWQPMAVGDKVAPAEKIASETIKHLNTNELEWSNGGDMIRALGMQHHNSHQQQHHNGRRQQVLRPTTPTLSRQLPGPGRQVAVPTAGYELGLAPSDAVQLVLPPDAPANSERAHELAHNDKGHNPARAPLQDWQISTGYLAQLEPAESVARPTQWQPPMTTSSLSSSSSSSTTARPRDPRAMSESGAKSADETSHESGEIPAASQTADERRKSEAADGANQERSQSSQLKAEPRQRRRIFNRILKKAEWNHLFLELSKVFLRYFLDLALKDIIGKQSGSTSGSDGTTTGRKKLEVQSELTDMLKEFIKTAITNI